MAKGDDCWEWMASTTTAGYGCFYDGHPWAAHRYSWVLHNGPITDPNMCVLHNCDNRLCVRPDHLFLGTKADNSRDMVSKGREKVPRAPGEAHHGARLTDDAVRHIRRSPERGRALAARYGVSESLVSLVRRRKAWRHIA